MGSILTTSFQAEWSWFTLISGIVGGLSGWLGTISGVAGWVNLTLGILTCWVGAIWVLTGWVGVTLGILTCYVGVTLGIWFASGFRISVTIFSGLLIGFLISCCLLCLSSLSFHRHLVLDLLSFLCPWTLHVSSYGCFTFLFRVSFNCIRICFGILSFSFHLVSNLLSRLCARTLVVSSYGCFHISLRPFFYSLILIL